MLPLNCTQAEYDAASPEDQRDFNRRLIEFWQTSDDRARDRDYAFDAAQEEGQWT